MALPTNFKDDILAQPESKRKYRMINNPDGTVSLVDVTEYQQIGSEFGAKQMNDTNGGINEINNKRLKTLQEVLAATQAGFSVDALAIKELSLKNPEIIDLPEIFGKCFKFGNGLMIQTGKIKVYFYSKDSNVDGLYKSNFNMSRKIPFTTFLNTFASLSYNQIPLAYVDSSATNLKYADQIYAMTVPQYHGFGNTSAQLQFLDIGLWK